jgi:N-acetylmuramoyl-L-alanine amidase
MMAAAARSIASRAGAALAVLALCACTPLPTQAPFSVVPGIAAEQRASPNFDQRRPSFVILHHTSDSSVEESLRTLTQRASGVSSHYLISRDGKVFYLVDEARRAWHAGESYWGGQRDLNSASIGIELDNNGREPFAESQIAALLVLLRDLKARYKLPAASFLGHGDIAPGRKVDPSVYFPWKRLAEHGFGLWCDPPYPAVPAGLDTALLLQAFGYNVWNFHAAMAAFKRRFVPEDAVPLVTEKDRAILYCLVQQMQTPAPEHPYTPSRPVMGPEVY